MSRIESGEKTVNYLGLSGEIVVDVSFYSVHEKQTKKLA